MEQMLLLTFTEKRSGKGMGTERINDDLAALMKEMSNYLDAAGKELLQPRKEAIQQLLKLAAQ